MLCEQRQQSQMLKFMAALAVVLGHQTGFYCSLPSIVVSETSVGALCVAFFLFMSGYGLLYGYVKKQQDLNGEWIGKRLLKLIVPALTAMLLYLVVELIVGKKVNWTVLFKYWFVSDSNLRYGWYVTEILVLYIAFWLSYRCLPARYAFWLLFCSIFVAMVLMIMGKCAVWYVQGLPCFVLGMFLAKMNLGEIKVSLDKSSGIRIKVVMSLVVGIFFCLKNFHEVQQIIPVLDKWRYAYLSYFLCDASFVVIIAYLLMRLPVCGLMVNRVGGYFYEVYLVQGATLLLCREIIENDWLFLLVGLLVTVAVAKVMSNANKMLIKLF